MVNIVVRCAIRCFDSDVWYVSRLKAYELDRPSTSLFFRPQNVRFRHLAFAVYCLDKITMGFLIVNFMGTKVIVPVGKLKTSNL